jgi:uncharacterized damage-inducible protein DinB
VQRDDDALLTVWRTSNRVTIEFVQSLHAALWKTTVPEMPRRTIGGIAAHLHNTRCMWIKTLGAEHGIATPARIDRGRTTPKQLASALKRSSAGIEALITLGLEHSGRVPPSKGYTWRNLSLDVTHVVTYFIAHEAHHRGQIVMVARQTGHRLPNTTLAGLWQWKPRAPR